MSITSFYFLVFLSLAAVIYYVIPKKYQWPWLLVISIVFYLLNTRILAVYLTITIISTYVIGRLMERFDQNYKSTLSQIKSGEIIGDKKDLKAKTQFKKRGLIWGAVGINLGMLVFLKFYNLMAAELNQLFFNGRQNVPILAIVLPLGISFYTFQALSYITDVYRGKIKAEHNFAKVALFLCFFPQVLQGPISRFDQLSSQLFARHSFNYTQIKNGILLMLWGFFKKMVIADRAAMLSGQVFDNYGDYAGFQFWIALVVYGAEMYGDFSGGIDIIRGAAQIFDIHMVDNFDRPYFSKSIPEFWRRWHVTLGTWFKDYLFYPLSLSKYATRLRKFMMKHVNPKLAKTFPSYVVCIILWLANGAWHGAGMQFMFFGIYHGILTCLSMAFKDKLIEFNKKMNFNQNCTGWRLFQVLRTFFLVSVGRIIYVAPNLSGTWAMTKSAFTAHNFWIFTDGSLFDLGLDIKEFTVLIVACLVLLLVEMFQRNHGVRLWVGQQSVVLRWGIYFALILTILIYGVYGPGYSAAGFIYMQY